MDYFKTLYIRLFQDKIKQARGVESSKRDNSKSAKALKASFVNMNGDYSYIQKQEQNVPKNEPRTRRVRFGSRGDFTDDEDESEGMVEDVSEENPRKEEVLHAEDLETIDLSLIDEPTAFLLDENEYYIVEKILDHFKQEDGTYNFLVTRFLSHNI